MIAMYKLFMNKTDLVNISFLMSLAQQKPLVMEVAAILKRLPPSRETTILLMLEEKTYHYVRLLVEALGNIDVNTAVSKRLESLFVAPLRIEVKTRVKGNITLIKWE